MADSAGREAALSPVKQRLLAKLVAGTRDKKLGQADAFVVPIRTTGAEPPLFLVHPIMGVVFPYYELASCLEPDRPIYGIQGFDSDGALIGCRTMESIAERYLAEVRKVQPEGPYHLGGWSFGSMAAYEMARQLAGSGEEVKLLCLVDSWAPGSGRLVDAVRFTFSLASDLWSFVADYVYLAGQNSQAGGSRLFASRSRLAALLTAKSDVTASKVPGLRPLVHAFVIFSKAVFAYHPANYRGRVHLIRTKKHAGVEFKDPGWGWGRLANGGVVVTTMIGNHMNLMKKPHVDTLADRIATAMRDVAG